MAYKRKTWREKTEDKENMPKILKLEKKFPCFNMAAKSGAKVGDKIILVNPSEVLSVMRKVKKGKLITIYEICKKIAKEHGVSACCSLTTGIFTMTIANFAEEMKGEGKDLKVAWWRTLKADGFLNQKFPGGDQNQKKLLEEEGFEIIARGKKYQVVDFKNYLVRV